MRRPMRSVVPGLLAGVAGLCLAVSASAVPPIVDRCPKEALAIVTIPNVEALQKDIQSIAQLIGQPIPDMNQALMMAGLEKGLKLDGAMAMVIFPPEPDAAKDGEKAEPLIVVLAPTTDYAALLDNFGIKPGEAGKVDSAQFQGKDMFAKNIGGGYAALSPSKKQLESFTGAAGGKAAFEAMLGKAGSDMTDKADLSVIVNMPVAKPLIEAGMKERMEEVADRMAMMGGDEPNFAAGEWMMKGILADARSTVATLNIDNLGVGLDMSVAFNDGSRMAKLAAAPGKAGELMGKLPAGAYLFAGAIDLASPELKQWIKDAMAQKPKDKKDKDKPADGADFAADLIRSLDTTNGAAFSMGFSPGGIMGGMLSSTVSYTSTSDPAGAIAGVKKQFEAMEAKNLAKFKWNAGGQDVGGKKVDVYEVRLLPDPENPMGPQIYQGLFGPMGGPSGYMATVDGGYYTTFSKNSKLLASALSAGKGEESLSKDKVVGQVGEKLPAGRMAELYIGAKSILDTIIPLTAMMGMPAPANEIPENLPPLALSVAPKSGAVQASMYFPAPTIKVIAEIAKGFQQAREDGAGDGAGAPAGRPQKKEGTGQPGF